MHCMPSYHMQFLNIHTLSRARRCTQKFDWFLIATPETMTQIDFFWCPHCASAQSHIEASDVVPLWACSYLSRTDHLLLVITKRLQI